MAKPMFSIEFKSNIEQVMKQVERKAFDHIDTTFRREFGQVRCPVHGEAPTRITKVGTGRQTTDYRIEGCCDELTKAIQQHFATLRSRR